MGIQGGAVVGVGYLVGEKGVWAQGVVGVSRRGVGVELAKGDWGLVGRKSLEVGTGPMEVSVSVAQSTHVHSHGIGLVGVLAMVGGAGCVVSLCSCVPWFSPSCVPCSLLPTSA